MAIDTEKLRTVFPPKWLRPGISMAVSNVSLANRLNTAPFSLPVPFVPTISDVAQILRS